MRYLLPALLLLTACTQREVARVNAAAEAHDDAYCQRIGARPGTPEYVHCRVSQNQTRATINAADNVIMAR